MSGNFQSATHTKIHTNTKKHTTNYDFWGNHGKRYAAAQAQIRRSACFLQLHLVICVRTCKCVGGVQVFVCLDMCSAILYIYTYTQHTHRGGRERGKGAASERERGVKKDAPV